MQRVLAVALYVMFTYFIFLSAFYDRVTVFIIMFHMFAVTGYVGSTVYTNGGGSGGGAKRDSWRWVLKHSHHSCVSITWVLSSLLCITWVLLPLLCKYWVLPSLLCTYYLRTHHSCVSIIWVLQSLLRKYYLSRPITLVYWVFNSI